MKKKLELYLDSLAETGELSKVSNEYVVTGKAIVTIENYEGAERRHRDNIKAQRRKFYLTFILVIFALVQVVVMLVQAGLIKLTMLIDLSGLK